MHSATVFQTKTTQRKKKKAVSFIFSSSRFDFSPRFGFYFDLIPNLMSVTSVGCIIRWLYYIIYDTYSFAYYCRYGEGNERNAIAGPLTAADSLLNSQNSMSNI